MTPAQLLIDQITAADRAIEQASKLLDAQSSGAGSSLLLRVRGRFANDLLALRNRCRSLRTRIQQGAPPQTGWGQLGQIEQDSSVTLGECLAFLEGSLVRGAGLDSGICEIADRMLEDISSRTDLAWQRFTLVAAGEFYSTVSGIVRLRFTDADIWSLPIAAHEFGHFAGASKTFADLTAMTDREKAADPRYESHLGELFSDLFATYVLGPAMPLSCALLRFSPSGAYGESRTHPSDAQRIWWMFETLAMMDRSEGQNLHAALIAQLGSTWADSVKGAGEADALSSEQIARLRQWLVELYDLMEAHLPSVRYRGILRAQELYQALKAGQDIALRDADIIPDVLNAAWLYRLNMAESNPFEVMSVGNKALTACQAIAAR